MDADKAYKTSLAEAVKKAAFYFGVALYLWDADEREEIRIAQEGIPLHVGGTQTTGATQLLELPEVHLNRIKAAREKLGFGKEDMPDIMKEYAKSILKSENMTSPNGLVGRSEAETEKNVSGFIDFMTAAKGK